MSVHWKCYPDAQAAARAAAHHILPLLDKPRASLAVSGGNTPKLLFEELAKSGLSWDRVHLFWADERAVPPTDPQSNYRLAEEFLIAPAAIPPANVHRIRAEIAPELAAKRYADEIREFFALGDGELPQFDVMQLGMGPDAHTASLFPGEPLIEDRTGIAAAVFAQKVPRWRVTLLPGVLLSARNTVFLAPGEDKAPAVRAVFNDPYDPQRFPSQIVSRHGRNVYWFLDEPAGKELLLLDPHGVE
jgi:6-phosphogluconolactonase